MLYSLFKKLVFLFGWVWLLTAQVFFYLVFNAYHIVLQVFTGGIVRWYKRRKNIITTLKELPVKKAYNHCRAIIEEGEYQYKGLVKNDKSIWGKFPTWTACSFVIFARKPKEISNLFWGNCQDAVSLAKWLYKKYAKIHKQRVDLKTHIYVPIFNLNLVHYLLSVDSTYIVSGETKGWAVRKEDRNTRAKSILSKRNLDWVWLK